MKSGFYNNIRLSNGELDNLKDIVRVSHTAPWILKSIDGLNAAQTVGLCGVYTNNSLVSFGWHMQRTWVLNGKSFTGLTIGVVTTAPSHRNHGYAKQLIAGIEEFARADNIDFLYLNGIPGFYGKFGFKSFAPKSKLVFKTADLPKVKGSIEALTDKHIQVVSQMHNGYSNKISSYAARSIVEWEDLIGPLTSTFLFHKPKVILNQDRFPIGYFCSTPGNSCMVREFVPLLDSGSVIDALAIVARKSRYFGNEKLEIFTPANGPVWEAATKSIDADFLCFLRPTGSNMLKWISTLNPMSDFFYNFILQGDML